MEMTSRHRHILHWELAGAVLMALAGSALHFVFAWTGNWPAAALIAAVNESIWEHLKLAFWPGLAWALIPVRAADVTLRIRLAVKGISLALTAALIVGAFLSYTSILGRNLLVLDIGTFVGAILAGQLVSAWLMARWSVSPVRLGIGRALLALQLAAYSLFTYFPPDFWLFVDGRTGLRGLP
jgi:hypothetical protein